MPRVIEQDRSIAKRCTCGECGAVNEYMPNEVRILHQGIDMSGCHCVTKGFNCAQCGAEVVTYAN